MNDSPPPMGHNNPERQQAIFDIDAYDKNAVDDLRNRLEKANTIAAEWIRNGAPTDAEQASKLTDFLTAVGKLRKVIDEARSVAKKPWDDKGRDVQNAFSPLLQMADAIKAKPNELMGDWLKAEQRRVAEERAKAEADAREARAAAQAALDRATESEDTIGRVEAERHLAAAEKAEKQASKDVKVSAGSASGAGRTKALVTVSTAKITNFTQVLLYFRDHPKVADLIQDLANNAVRSKNIDHTVIPGIEVITEQVAR